jgi:Leucine-rich repeat (LRR) protein
LGNLSNLKKLVIRSALKPIPDFFAGLCSLEEFGLGSQTISSLPDSICSLPSLIDLNIDCDMLNALPENFGNLKRLKTLSINSKRLDTLPITIKKLRSLSKLHLTNAKIKTLPDSIGGLSELEELYLLRCEELESLPETIINLQKLKTLYIRGSKIKALPEWIGNLRSLIGLHLQYTDISSLPDSIGNLSKLESLEVYNSIDDYGFWVKDYLYYDEERDSKRKSPFTGLPETASRLSALKYLNLNNTGVTSLPDYLGDLPALEVIEVIDCDIIIIPPSIQRLVDSNKLFLARTEDDSHSAWFRKCRPGGVFKVTKNGKGEFLPP